MRQASRFSKRRVAVGLLAALWVTSAWKSGRAAAAERNVVEVHVRSLSTERQTDVPVSFGHVFRRGDVAPGNQLHVFLDGRFAQVDTKRTYDDGSRFYSPSSLHRFLRHSVTGKLYWCGNICADPPKANSPRYPLIIAEVDETIPALKRDTVTVIDDRGPDDSAKLQLSNFCLFEDKESGKGELYLTRLVPGDEGSWSGHAYKYTLTFQ